MACKRQAVHYRVTAESLTTQNVMNMWLTDAGLPCKLAFGIVSVADAMHQNIQDVLPSRGD